MKFIISVLFLLFIVSAEAVRDLPGEVKKVYSKADLQSDNFSVVEKYILSYERDRSWICGQDCTSKGISIESSGVNSSFCSMSSSENCEEKNFYIGGQSTIPDKLNIPLNDMRRLDSSCKSGDYFIWVSSDLIGFSNLPAGLDVLTVVLGYELVDEYCNISVNIFL